MADEAPSTVKVSLANAGRGPRTYFGADREVRMLRPGERVEDVEILEADRESLQDLSDAFDASPTTDVADASVNERRVNDFPSLDGKDKAQLLAIANDEGYSLMSADASEDEIREAIEAAREASKEAAEATSGDDADKPAPRRRGRAAE